MAPVFDQSSQQRIDHVPYHAINHLAWPAGHSMDWHQHNYFQIIHVLSGELEVDWGNGWTVVKANHCHILPPGHEHRLRSIKGHRQFGVNFTNTNDERGLNNALIEQFSEPCIVANPNPPLNDVFHEHARVQLAALDLYHARLLQQHQTTDPEAAERQRILEIIDAHLQTASDVHAWSEQLHCSRATAQRRCKELFNCGLAQLHEKRRLHACAHDLISSTKSIEQIAYHWGFADSTSFGRAFKRVFQESPRNWRNHARQQGV